MLNDDLRYLLRQIGNADMEQIKKAAVVLCANEAAKSKSENNRKFCEKTKEQILHSPQFLIMSQDRALFADIEVGDNFDDGLYYVSALEQKVEERILTMQRASEKLQALTTESQSFSKVILAPARQPLHDILRKQ